MSIPSWWRVTLHRTISSTISRIRCSHNRRVMVKRELTFTDAGPQELATVVFARTLQPGETVVPAQHVTRGMTLVTQLALTADAAKALAQALHDVGYRPVEARHAETVEVIDVDFVEIKRT